MPTDNPALPHPQGSTPVSLRKDAPGVRHPVSHTDQRVTWPGCFLQPKPPTCRDIPAYPGAKLGAVNPMPIYKRPASLPLPVLCHWPRTRTNRWERARTYSPPSPVPEAKDKGAGGLRSDIELPSILANAEVVKHGKRAGMLVSPPFPNDTTVKEKPIARRAPPLVPTSEVTAMSTRGFYAGSNKKLNGTVRP
ncbi:hypothetical protein NUW54_g12996 [Trametes sanguinea]|uniref:Uncharacterized protein n=1 Tax=Trametes sanguinea TaxID=158606 RepID=A0ACC1MQL5_9APHY|nr:hypothetical protein NUW54_g12996 [Trametes sanguinea]